MADFSMHKSALVLATKLGNSDVNVHIKYIDHTTQGLLRVNETMTQTTQLRVPTGDKQIS